ncbi:hypothetical protein OnM2_078036 [Erysiphe neolycopersici]|uniref:Uncharacterized protein n=1 Tax=Erysiphe neolycopersici TaxID=212602 RepID=A0A420HHF3_9PEZI|nr:hypothetical protein OnM2_078036 [Erysiphe neolycopersici]
MPNFVCVGGSTAARIKRNKKSSQTKFKVRCQKYLYTLYAYVWAWLCKSKSICGLALKLNDIST